MAGSAYFEKQAQKAQQKASEIAGKYEKTDPGRATQIKDILESVIEFRLGECLNDTDRKKKYSDLVFRKFDDIVGSGFDEGKLVEYIGEMAKIIV